MIRAIVAVTETRNIQERLVKERTGKLEDARKNRPEIKAVTTPAAIVRLVSREVQIIGEYLISLGEIIGAEAGISQGVAIAEVFLADFDIDEVTADALDLEVG